MSFIFFLLGFYALLSQVILFREMAIIFQGHEIALGISLAAWLLWVGLGSVSKKSAFPDNPRRSLAVILLTIGVMIPVTDVLIRLSKLLIAQGTAPNFLSSLVWPFIFLAPVCWLIGRAFGTGVAVKKGQGGWLYFMESLGAVLGGLFSIFILSGQAPSFAVIAAGGGLLTLSGWWLWRAPLHPLPLIAILLNVALTFLSSPIDSQTRRLQWLNSSVLAQKETRFDHLLIAKRDSVTTLYQNGAATAQNPDLAHQEELVHGALLAHPSPKRVLALGLPTLFAMNEIRKHPVDSLEFVEPDHQAVEFLVDHPLLDSRIARDLLKSAISAEPRRWIKTHPRTYDVIILSMPDPTNAALNRFFTVEFFRDARAALKEGGILAFTLPSSDIDPAAGAVMENMSILKAAKSPFAFLEIMPGSKMMVLASGDKLDLDPNLLISRYRARRLKNLVFTPETIPLYLDPARREALWKKASRIGGVAVNTDLKPITYALAWKVWFSKFSSPWFFAGPMILAVVAAWTFRKMWTLHRKRWQVAEQNLLFLVGFAGMVTDMTGLLLFQSLSGALYWQLGLLNSSFMLGLVAGSGLTARVKLKEHLLGLLTIALVMGGFSLVVALNLNSLYALSNVHLTSVFVFFLFIPGFLVGAAFPFAVAGFAPEAAGELYAADLWGSALGAFLSSAFLIPLLGYSRVLFFTSVILFGLGVLPHLAFVMRKDPSILGLRKSRP